MANPGKPELKKPYATPQLTVYGTVQALTQQNTNSGHFDSARTRDSAPRTHV